MASLAELYLKGSITHVFKIYHDPLFWPMIQDGLVNIDSLVRKRCLYLLHNVVQMCKHRDDIDEMYMHEKTSPIFMWNPDDAKEILHIWQQYIFFLETLEEKQVGT